MRRQVVQCIAGCSVWSNLLTKLRQLNELVIKLYATSGGSETSPTSNGPPTLTLPTAVVPVPPTVR